jgi:hypothetical protein
MIIETQKQLDIVNIVGDIPSIEAGIDKESMPFLFEMLSKSLYSNPIGSICREITSNCFDSHIEANVDDAVIIKKGYDSEGYYISFSDVGVGLNPERIKDIYMNYFSSTKRNSNELIGGFGLGSKSPLSYTDHFYITTIFNNIQYQYIFSKGITVPTLDLLNKTDISDRNGTEIKIYIEDNDVYKFRDELIKQLCYFDNVYFENWNIDNNYTIYEGEYFKFKNKNRYSDKMHIVINKVSYSIDWKQLGIEEYNIAVGIKFNIGELLITPNREQIRYTDEIINLIKNRINKAVNELINIFNKNNKSNESFFEWYDIKNSKPFILFEDTKNNKDKLYLYGLKDIDKKHKYKYFEGLNNINEDDIFELFYKYLGNVINNKFKSESYINLIYKLKYSPESIYITDKYNISNDKNWLVNNGFIIQEKLNIDKLKKLCLIFDNKDIHCKYYFNLGVGLKLYKLKIALKNEIKDITNKYRDLTKTELQEYNKEQCLNNLKLQRKLNNKVLVKNSIDNSKFEWNLYKNNNKIKSINNYTGIIIYGYKEDINKLNNIIEIINLNKPSYLTNNNILKIIQISKDSTKYFKNKKNMFYVDDFNECDLFKNIASTIKIKYFFEDIESNTNQKARDYIKNITLICSNVGNILETLYKFYINTNYTNYRYNDKLLLDVLTIANKYNSFNPNIEYLFDKLNIWYKDVELLKYININDSTLPYILKTLYSNKKKLNVEYYQKVLNTDNSKQLTLNFNNINNNITKYNFIIQNPKI